MKSILTIAIFASLGLSGLAHADREGHGGETSGVAQSTVRHYVATLLRPQLHRLFEIMDLSLVRDENARAALKYMRDENVAKDIFESPYDVFAPSCPVEVQKAGKMVLENKSASANLNARGGRICFDIPKLAREAATFDDLIALAAHEHAHHFGYPDEDKVIQRAVLAYLKAYGPQLPRSVAEWVDASDRSDKGGRHDIIEKVVISGTEAEKFMAVSSDYSLGLREHDAEDMISSTKKHIAGDVCMFFGFDRAVDFSTTSSSKTERAFSIDWKGGKPLKIVSDYEVKHDWKYKAATGKNGRFKSVTRKECLSAMIDRGLVCRRYRGDVVPHEIFTWVKCSKLVRKGETTTTPQY